MFRSIRKLHFVGIGGIGMSGIAEILIDQGFAITGSDKAESDNTERIVSLGAKVYIGHDAKHLEADVDALVYSSALTPDNPEIIEAQRRKLPVIRRAEMLAEVMRLKYGIGIAGTHGKTTTTSMVSLVLMEGGIDPTVIVGGRLHGLAGSNARLGKGEFIVVEADEFDRSFLSITPTIAVLTTLETDHLDCYRDLEDIKSAFIQFASKVPFYGFVVLCLDEPALQEIMPKIKKKIITYGLNGQADLQAVDVRHKENATTFIVIREGKELGEITLQIPGKHNVQNALAAIAVGLELQIPFAQVKAGIEKFTGVFRRWEVKAEINGIMVVDDYAHHPTEIAVTLAGVKSGWRRRVVCVFQPHLYSRTRDFYEDFGRAFFNADILVLTDIYPAREEPIQGITGELIANTAKEFGHKNVHYVPDKKHVSDFLMKMKRSGDIIITMGAGDIWKYGEEFIKKLKGEKA
ncbi:MAG: UDP-N-acetylmuramate--L-alanine ligase [Bacteroidetes bacterium]|nr:UDP-N-acetylmuramate--L-alanine ligase [Bacteroidota bacterium]MCW5894617.1 UDP-N-acetylmuramate--L-alanine ligase [Bacteroidota bacterium]